MIELVDTIQFDEYFNALITPIPDDGRHQAFKQEKMNYNRMDQFKMISNVNINNKRNHQLPPPEGEMTLEPEEEEEEKKPALKKAKKPAATKNPNKKKKETPKRKRVNYCFEIHRSGCLQNKDSKLYCKVFLKGKLQCEVDLIKGARGKWAYTFYDQRKKKKERRYWPSQSSGPVIEDSCHCDKCTPTSSVNDEEVDFSSPSTEEATLIEYESNPNIIVQSEYQVMPHQQYQTEVAHQQQIHPYYFHKMQQNAHSMNEMQELNPPYVYAQKNIVTLKSSNDFQDNNQQQQQLQHHQQQHQQHQQQQQHQPQHYVLKSSNDFVNHQQRPWDYFSNNMEYSHDGFFVENSFL